MHRPTNAVTKPERDSIMCYQITDILDQNPIIPLIQCTDRTQAVQVARALQAGGMTAVEMVLRTPDAMSCVEAIADSVPDLTVGVGTVLSVELARKARACGAEFIVSPGLDELIVGFAASKKLPCLPGVATPSEVQEAAVLGLRAVKFFPASLLGGTDMLGTLSSVFPDMQFVPTGGLSAANFLDYLAIESVPTCGGSWIASKKRVAMGDYAGIEAAARFALDAYNDARHKQ